MNLTHFKNQLELSDETNVEVEEHQMCVDFLEDTPLYLEDYTVEAQFSFTVIGNIVPATYLDPSEDNREIVGLECNYFEIFNIEGDSLTKLNEEQRKQILNYFNFQIV